MNAIKRLLAALSLGYVLYFYSELAFWGRWKADDTIIGAIMTWLIYSVLAFFVLLMAERLKADSPTPSFWWERSSAGSLRVLSSKKHTRPFPSSLYGRL